MPVRDIARITTSKFDGVYSGTTTDRVSLWTMTLCAADDIAEQLEWSRRFSISIGGLSKTPHVLVQSGSSLSMFREWDSNFCPLASALTNGLHRCPVKPGNSVLVLGASPTTLLALSELVGPAGHVHAVVSPTFDPMCQNLLANRCRNITMGPFSGSAVDAMLVIPPPDRIEDYLYNTVRPLVPGACWVAIVLPANVDNILDCLSSPVVSFKSKQEVPINGGCVVIAKSSSRGLSSILNFPHEQELLVDLGIVHDMVPTDLEIVEAATNVIAGYQGGSISGPMAHRLCSLAMAQVEPELPSLQQLVFDLSQQIQMNS